MRIQGELVSGLLDLNTWGCTYFEMQKKFVPRAAGCERKSDHDEVGWGTAPPCADPTDSRARSGQLVLAQNWIAEKGGRGLGCLGGGARNDSHHVVCRLIMCRFAGTQPGGSGLEKSRVAREKLVGLGHGRRIGGGFAPGLGAGLPWRRCKMQSKAKDARTLQ